MKTARFYLLIFSIFWAGVINAQNTFNWENATVYFLLTDRFNDGNSANNASYGRTSDPIGGFLGGDISGLTAKINSNYFTDLGVTAIWITAPYEQIHGAVPGYWGTGYPNGSHYAYHGYYPLDFTQMDANIGTATEFQTMVDAAHAKGIRILMDIVLNHVGYETMVDSQEFGFGTLGNPWSVPNTGLDPNNASWCNWWVDNSGVSWVRKGDTATDYCSPACGGGDKPMCLAGLPDVRTEHTGNVGLPKILQTKWDATKETQENNELTAFWNANPTYPRSPANYIVKWLTDWVREFGIDGFRIDTYKHVETEVWGRLKDQAQVAFNDWKTANPSKKLDDTPFWMVGELYGAGIGRNTDAITNGKTDATINFNFQTANLATANLESIYSSYATTFAAPDWTSMSYISSHDTYLYNRNSLYQAGAALLLCPGPIQIYYGDETKRLAGTTTTDQDTRTFMNWSSIDNDLLTHWQKIGKFRKNHLSVGGGRHTQITTSSGYAFKREYTDVTTCDQIVAVMGASGATTVDVSSLFTNGTLLRDTYTSTTATVTAGNVTFTAHTNGVILIENAGGNICKPSLTVVPTPSQASNSSYYHPTSLSVALTATTYNAATDLKIFYTTNGTTPTPASTLYTSSLTFGNPTNVTLKAIACENSNTLCSAVESKNVVVGPIPDITVYFRRPTAWGSTVPSIYYWGISPVGAIPDITWATAPAMTALCNGWYKYTFSGVLGINVIVKGPSSQTADYLGVAADTWADATSLSGAVITPTWLSVAPSSLSGVPSVTLTPSSNFNTSQSVSITAAACGGGTPTIYYTTNGSTPTTSSTSGTSPVSFNVTATTTVRAIAVNSNGTSAIETATYTQSTITPITVYFKKPAAWSGTPNAYYWIPPSTAGVATWPGQAMTSVCGDWYKFTLQSGTVSANIIFNNGSGGTANQTTDIVGVTSTTYYDGSTGSGFRPPLSSTTAPSGLSSFRSAGSGLWHVASTWVCGRVPTASDDVEIMAGHTITVKVDDAVAKTLINMGTLIFTPPKLMLGN
jgi:alpha-amylase